MRKSKKGGSRNAGSQSKRQRLTPAIRRAQIVESAARLVVLQGYLPLPIEKLAKVAGTSNALIYAYFPEQDALFNALLERELSGLLAAGLDTASQIENLEQAAVLCAQLYFEHVARHGPLLNILLSDRYMVGRIAWRLLRMRNTVFRRLAKLVRAHVSLTKREVLAAIEMMTAIPEEAGRLAFHGELDIAVVRQICRSLTLSCLRALRAPDRVLSGAHDIARSLHNHGQA